MKITVDTIADQGLRVPISLDLPWAAQAAALALEAPPSALTGELLVERRDTVARVTGAVRAVVSRVCERCGEPVELDLRTGDTELAYVPSDSAPAGAELRLGAADLDLGWYEAGRLDLAEVLSELLALELPSRISCHDVPACDARVERLLAGSPAGASDSPFAALRDLY